MMTIVMAEVIRVSAELFLAAFGRREHENEHDCYECGLRTGFYLVVRHKKSTHSKDLGSARYFGPFPNKAIPEKLKTSALHLGLIDSCVDEESNRIYYATLFDDGHQDSRL